MNHMAQLRHDYPHFQALETEVVVVVPNGPRTIQKFLGKQDYPYPILSDKGSVVATEVFHIRKLLSFVLPTVFVVDRIGHIRYIHNGRSPLEEPGNEQPLAILTALQVKP